jgi:hypothetical protein
MEHTDFSAFIDQKSSSDAEIGGLASIQRMH